MDSNNTSGTLKRQNECELRNEPTTSKQIKTDNSTVGVITKAGDNTNIKYGDTNVNNNNGDTCINNVNIIYMQQPEQQEQPPNGIKFDVTDPVDSFWGRDSELDEVHAAFKQKHEKRHNLVAVCGYGGIGKSEFARMYIKQHREDFHNVVWVYAESEEKLKGCFDKLQNELINRGYKCTTHQDIYKFLNSDKCIIVFDNVENMKSIESFLPQKDDNKTLILITSQNSYWSPHKPIILGKLSNKKAKHIIEVVLKKHEILISKNELQDVINKFESIPLVLQIVAGFICQQVIKLRSIDTNYNIKDIVQKLWTDYKLVTENCPEFFCDPYSKSVYAALSTTLEKIWNKENTFTVDMLGIAAYLDADYITKDILKNLLNTEEEIFNEALASLVQFSLFQITGSKIIMHRTVQQCLQYYCSHIIKSKRYYFLALSVVFIPNNYRKKHYDIICQHGEKDKETFVKFYKKKKCNQLYIFLINYVTKDILSYLLVNTDLIRNPEFLGMSALCSHNRRDFNIIQVLLDHGVDFDTEDEKGLNALCYACLSTPGDKQVASRYSLLWNAIKIITKEGKANINWKNSSNCTVLHILCDLKINNLSKDEDLFTACTFLLKLGADVNIKNLANQTPADIAQKFGFKHTFELFKSFILGHPYIAHIAAQCKQLILLYWLTRNKICNITERDHLDRTVLHVLLDLEKQDAKNEESIFYITWRLVKWYNIDLSVRNNDGQTAEDVAERCGRTKIQDYLNSQAPPGRIIYKVTAHQSKIAHFPFVCKDIECVNDQDETGNTLLHAVCDLDADSDRDLELDIVKLAVHLVIRHRADVHVKNNGNKIAADVARNRKRLLIAEFLESSSLTGEELICVAVKHKEFKLIKYVWWRYLNTKLELLLYPRSNQPGFSLLPKLCALEAPNVSDEELVQVIESLNFDLIAKYFYRQAVENAKQNGRVGLAKWMKTRYALEDSLSSLHVNHFTYEKNGTITHIDSIDINDGAYVTENFNIHCDLNISCFYGIMIYDEVKLLGNFNKSGTGVVVLTDVAVNGHVIISGGVTIFYDVKVDGNVTVSGDASHFCNVKVFGDLNINGDVIFSGNVKLSGDVKFSGDVHFCSVVKFEGDVEFSGNVKFSGYVKFSGNVKFSGDVHFFSVVKFEGNVEFCGNVKFSDNAKLSGDVAFSGDDTIFDDVKINGDVIFSDDIKFSGNVKFFDNVHFLGVVKFEGDVEFSGNVKFSGDVHFFGVVKFEGDVEFSGNVKLSGDVKVSINVIFSDDVKISGLVKFSGDVKFFGDVKLSAKGSSLNYVTQNWTILDTPSPTCNVPVTQT